MSTETISAPLAAGLAPVGARERVAELDVLRGVALYGVFLVNMKGFAGAGLMATEAQLMALPTAPLDHALTALCDWLMVDKANTLFAFLFGLGFWLQLQRAEARGADFERLYVRRLAVLFGFGVVHTLLLWSWDILHLYALTGFLLLALRGASDRVLVAGGFLLTVLGRTAYEVVLEFAGAGGWRTGPGLYDEAAVHLRQQLSSAGDYPGLVRAFAAFTLAEWVLSGMILGWITYALGRFMLGAWVGRRGWLTRAPEYLPGFRRGMRIALPAGLIAEGLAVAFELHAEAARLPAWEHWGFLAEALHLSAVPVLAAGYVCAIVTGLHAPRGRPVLAPFAHVGRMALTNYVAQSVLIGLVLFGVGPGLDLAGRIGFGALIVVVSVAFAGQILVSRWWLARFRHGPLEWLWRGLTYGRWPAWRLRDAAV
jgi:uncharacterized protein